MFLERHTILPLRSMLRCVTVTYYDAADASRHYAELSPRRFSIIFDFRRQLHTPII